MKGFTEALHVEFQTHAPHIHVAVVMPGHIGTSIAEKAGSEVDPKTGKWIRTKLTPEMKQGLLSRISQKKPQMAKMLEGKDEAETNAIIEQIREAMDNEFKNNGLSAADAATLIIRGTLEKRWRILLGDDAYRLDQAVRSDPEGAYATTEEGVRRMWESKETAGWAVAGALRVEEPATVTAEPASGRTSSRARL